MHNFVDRTSLLELETTQLEAFLLETLDDVADQPPLHRIRLDHDEGTLTRCHGHSHAPLLLARSNTERRSPEQSEKGTFSER
jgi:hypothetical protein